MPRYSAMPLPFLKSSPFRKGQGVTGKSLPDQNLEFIATAGLDRPSSSQRVSGILRVNQKGDYKCLSYNHAPLETEHIPSLPPPSSLLRASIHPGADPSASFPPQPDPAATTHSRLLVTPLQQRTPSLRAFHYQRLARR